MKDEYMYRFKCEECSIKCWFAWKLPAVDARFPKVDFCPIGQDVVHWKDLDEAQYDRMEAIRDTLSKETANGDKLKIITEISDEEA